MAASTPAEGQRPLVVLAVTQGLWGERIAENIQRHAPPHWTVQTWAAPRAIPPVVEDPEEYITSPIPKADLLLALGETAGLAQLIPDLARLSGCQSVLAPIDRNESLPKGLMEQLRGWLGAMGVRAVFPRPLCTLGEETINRWPIVERYDDALVREFSRWFGQPKLVLAVEGGAVTRAEVTRDSACGCARYVAEGLVGVRAADAAEQAGMLHHHYPCLGSMNIDADYRDTLMHVSGNCLKDEVAQAVAPHVPVQYLRPAGRVDDV